MMTIRKTALFIIVLSFVLIGRAFCFDSDTIFQTSNIDALIDGMYDGDVTVEELVKFGDFGIGTFDNLDGEMVVLDGVVYQIKVNGKVYRPKKKTETPFAVVTQFEADRSFLLSGAENLKSLKKYISKLLYSKEIFYAIRIEGPFEYIKVRSVPAQKKPYPKLIDVIKEQKTYELKNIDGTILGFWCPEYAKGMNVPGFHFHFISRDRKRGGHVLDCRVQDAEVILDETDAFLMTVPQNAVTPEGEE